MTEITTLAALNVYDRIELGGYTWVIFSNSNDTLSLSPSGDNQLAGCQIIESPGKDSDAPTFHGYLTHPAISDLTTHRYTFSSLADAVKWASGFQWATRKVGSITWFAQSAEAHRWHAKIGHSHAEIYRSEHGENYQVSRQLRFGNQLVDFKISDLAFGKNEEKAITTFEQASAIALTMTDYVLELMRNVESTG